MAFVVYRVPQTRLKGTVETTNISQSDICKFESAPRSGEARQSEAAAKSRQQTNHHSEAAAKSRRQTNHHNKKSHPLLDGL